VRLAAAGAEGVQGQRLEAAAFPTAEPAGSAGR
jgi:hypothetical protein